MRFLKYCLAGVAVVILAVSCDLFRTRDAEPPDTGRHLWVTPRVPEDVLTNLATALFDRDRGNYLLSFDQDRFQFEADPIALERHPSLEGWDYEQESLQITQLFADSTLRADSQMTVLFTDMRNHPAGDSEQITVHYDLTAPLISAAIPHYYAGTAEFILKVGRDEYWQITHWTDRRTEDASTWSDLKSFVP